MYNNGQKDACILFLLKTDAKREELMLTLIYILANFSLFFIKIWLIAIFVLTNTYKYGILIKLEVSNKTSKISRHLKKEKEHEKTDVDCSFSYCIFGRNFRHIE